MPEQTNFTVAATDRATGNKMDLSVGIRPGVSNQEEAEVYIAHSMPRARGGSHPGFDVTPVDADKFNKLLAQAQADAPKGE